MTETKQDYLSLTDTWNLPFVALHGSLMLFLWNVWMPLGALYMRHWGRARPNAVWIHAGFQMIGCVLCLLSGAMIVFNDHAPMSVLQQVFGWPVFILTFAQIGTGFRQLSLRVSPDSTPLPHERKRGRRIHGRLGLIVGIIALINSPQGIHLMAPIHERPVHPMWLFYWITAISFVIATCVLEYMRHRRYVTARQLTFQRGGKADDGVLHPSMSSLLLMPHAVAYKQLSTLNRAAASRNAIGEDEATMGTYPKTAGMPETAHATVNGAAMKSSQLQQEQLGLQNQIPGLPAMSWAELDTSIRTKGEYWVIGPGNTVIDIRQWISTHPGGQQILLDSVGTCVLRDVFPMASNRPVTPAMSTEEWLHVSASRRESKHSTEALDKMRNMIVGYIKQSPGVPPGHYDPLEYRRYALVRKEASSGPGATRATFLFGLAELYPSGPGAPAFFLPGHVIEIRMRISKSAMAKMGVSNSQVRARIPPSGWISRYYTPISGSMSRFDVTVKLVTDGVMSSLFKRLSPSEYPHVQVRGPFGTPLLNPARPLSVSNGSWDHVVILCAGSGSVAALQFATWMFLNAHFPGTLERAAGDMQAGIPVIVLRPSSEPGQVVVMPRNATLQNQELFQVPLNCVTPWVGKSPRLTVVCAESDYASITGRAVFDNLSDAYPAQFQVHYRTDSLPPSARIPNITQGTVTSDYIHTTLMSRSEPANTQFIICGPKRFVDECYGVMEEIVEQSNITCLPPHTFLSRPIPPVLKDGMDPELFVRKDAKGAQLWFTRVGQREKGSESVDVKQPPVIA